MFIYFFKCRNRHNLPSTDTRRDEEEDWNNDVVNQEKFHVLPLPERFIHVIDDEHKLMCLLEKELVGVEIIGFDAEWKPAFGTKITSLALLQIATLDNVYILDLLALEKNSHWWHTFGCNIFGNDKIIKLGEF